MGATRYHPNPFLRGNGAPLRTEYDLSKLRVIGRLPHDLYGGFFRIGANPQFEPHAPYHIFEGDGMVHAFYFKEGQVSYKNRWIRTPRFLAERSAGRSRFGLIFTGRKTEPRALLEVIGMAPLKILQTIAKRRDLSALTDALAAANTTVVHHGGRTFATFELSPPVEFEPSTLRTLGLARFSDDFSGPFTAHPKIDPKTKEMFSFGFTPFPPQIRYDVFDSRGVRTYSTRIKMPFATMMHDFAVTEHHAVFIAGPAVVSVRRNFQLTARWRPELGTQCLIVPRYGGAVQRLVLDACFVFHVLNAFEADGLITIDLCELKRIPKGVTEPSAQIEPQSLGKLTRWRIDPVLGKVDRTPIDADHIAELPRLDDRRAMTSHRFGYVSGLVDEAPPDWFANAVIAHDMKTGARKIRGYGAKGAISEVAFVARRGGTEENDGYLLVAVYLTEEDRTDLLILDARDIELAPLATVQLPHRIPSGFHSTWIDGGALWPRG